MRSEPTRDIIGSQSLVGNLRERLTGTLLLQLLNSLLLAIPVLAVIVSGYQQRWISEDAFISLRVADQLLTGNGPVFNLGERVEAHTNPLWVAILAIFGAFGSDMVQAALFLGLLLSAAGMFAAISGAIVLEERQARRSDDNHPGLLMPVGALAFIAVPITADFITSGLESGLGFGWLGISFWILAQRLNRKIPEVDWRWYAGAVVLGLGPLIRPDFAIFSAGFLLALLALPFLRQAARPRAGGVALFVLAAGALPVAYQIFRMGYYALPVPNTAIAKEAGLANWEQGRIYFNDFVDPYWLWVPIALFLGLWLLKLIDSARSRSWADAVVLAVPVLTAALHALYVVRVGGDFMHGRLLLPAFFALLMPLAMVRLPLSGRTRTAVTWTATVGVLIWATVSLLFPQHPHGAEVDEETGIANERAFYVVKTGHPDPVTLDDYAANGFEWVRLGRYVNERAGSEPRAVLIRGEEYPVADHVPETIRLVVPEGNIGIMGYAAGTSVHVVDRLGLADPIGSRIEIDERDRPGHEKALPMVWVAARFTGVPAEDVNDPAFGAARAALECGRLAELGEALTAPMTVDRFLENIGKSWSFYEMRIPKDPEEARARFCSG